MDIANAIFRIKLFVKYSLIDRKYPLQQFANFSVQSKDLLCKSTEIPHS